MSVTTGRAIDIDIGSDYRAWLSQRENNPDLCSVCTWKLGSIESRELGKAFHCDFSGFLAAVADKCFVCWRLFQTLDTACRESFKTLAKYENLMDTGPKSLRGELCAVTYMSVREDDENDRIFHLNAYFGSSCFQEERWEFDPKSHLALTQALEVMRQFSSVTFLSESRGFNYWFGEIGNEPEVLEFVQGIRPRTGSVDATAWEDSINLIRGWLRVTIMIKR